MSNLLASSGTSNFNSVPKDTLVPKDTPYFVGIISDTEYQIGRIESALNFLHRRIDNINGVPSADSEKSSGTQNQIIPNFKERMNGVKDRSENLAIGIENLLSRIDSLF